MIEYEDEDVEIRRRFEANLKRLGTPAENGTVIIFNTGGRAAINSEQLAPRHERRGVVISTEWREILFVIPRIRSG